MAPVDLVRKFFVDMENQGELQVGDELPRPMSVFTALGIKRVAFNMAIWELVVNGEVARIDQRLFWGAAPDNTRSREQISLILLNMIAEGAVSELEPLPPTSIVGEAFNAPYDVTARAYRLLTRLGIATASTKRLLTPGAQAKAKRAAEAFAFSFPKLEQKADDCFASIGSSQNPAKALHAWRNQYWNQNETLFLCSKLLCHFGAADKTGKTTKIALRTIQHKEFVQRIQQCRQWLRRYHWVNQGDHILISIAAL